MNKTERIKAGFVGKRWMTNTETGEQVQIDFDDFENIGVFRGDEVKAVMDRLEGQKNYSDKELKSLSHCPDDEYEDLDFLEEYEKKHKIQGKDI